MEEARQGPGAGISSLVCHFATQRCKKADLEGTWLQAGFPNSPLFAPSSQELLSRQGAMGRRHGRGRATQRIHSVVPFSGARGCRPLSQELTSHVCPWKGGWRLNLCKWSPVFPPRGDSFSEGPSGGRDSSTGTSLLPREHTFVHLSAGTIYVYLNRLLFNFIRQRLDQKLCRQPLFIWSFQIWACLPVPPSAGPDAAGPPVLDVPVAGLQALAVMWAH